MSVREAGGAAEPWLRGIVSGHPSIRVAGEARDDAGDPLCSKRNPRTALGSSGDRRTPSVAVVRGRSATRVGMRRVALAVLVRDLGGHDVTSLDAARSHDPDNHSCGATQSLFHDGSPCTTPIRADVRLRPAITGRTGVLDAQSSGESRVRLIVRDATGRTSNDAFCFLDLRDAG
jgi:hypothetical protein